MSFEVNCYTFQDGNSVAAINSENINILTCRSKASFASLWACEKTEVWT